MNNYQQPNININNNNNNNNNNNYQQPNININNKRAATVQEFQQSASDIACYNDAPSQVFSTLRSVAKKLLKDDVRYRTLDTTNPKVMERLIGFEGVLDFLMLLGFESDAMGMKLICETKPSQQIVRNAIEVLNTYESRLGLGRKNKNKGNDKADDEQSYVTLGGPNDKKDNKKDKDEQDTLTLEQIIIWSTHENMRDNDTMETLILTHKQFTTSLTLLKNLRRRFDVPIPNDIRNDNLKINEFRLNVQKRIQLKVIKSLRDWMKTYWDEDFLNDLEVQKELISWLADLEELKIQKQTECPWIKPLSSMVSKEFERFKLKSPNQARKLENIKLFKLNPDSGIPQCLEHVSIKKGYKLSNTTAEDLADQITLMDYKIFSNIAERECIGQCWKKRKEESPNVLAMIQQFNNLTVFVQLQILSEKSLKDRSKAIKRVIKMGERFKELKNYNSLCAILGALNSSPIHRLKLAWQRVPEKTLNQFESFKQIFINTRNFRNFRTLFRQVSPPAIPYFGLFLQDLVFIDDGNDSFNDLVLHLSVGLELGGLAQAHQQLLDDVEEEGHGDEPADPTRRQVTSHGQLPVIAADDHQGRANTQRLCLGIEGRVIQLHDKQDLDEQQWNGQEPIHVTIRIVEGHACQLGCRDIEGTVYDPSSAVGVGLHPGVEDADVVICCDEGHESRGQHCTLVLVMDRRRAEPQIHGGGHHACQGEGQRVVHRLVLHVAHHVHHPH